MKKRIIICIMLFVNFYSILYAQNFKGHVEKFFIQEPNQSLRVGETLKFKAEWLGVPVGYVVLKVVEIVKINNRDCYHITAEAMPNRYLRRIVDLEYKVHTYIDTQSLYPLRFEKIRRMKNEYNHVVIDFDQEKHEAIYKDEGSAGTKIISPVQGEITVNKPPTNKIENETQDLLSSFYYFRLLKIKENSLHSMNIYYGRRNWKIDFKVEEPFSRDLYRKGTFTVFKVTPSSELNNFILGKRNFSIFFTADSYRIPIEFRFSTGIGAIRCLIQEIPR